MFISCFELFKIGIGPSSSHTTGPMIAAKSFRNLVGHFSQTHSIPSTYIRCTLKGALAHTGKGHGSDRAVVLGLHGYSPEKVARENIEALLITLKATQYIELPESLPVSFCHKQHIIFDTSETLAQHPNGMVFELCSSNSKVLLSETYFSIGGGFIKTLEEVEKNIIPKSIHPYAFNSAKTMLQMSNESGLSIAEMKRQNEIITTRVEDLDNQLDDIWRAMQQCLERGLIAEGSLPGGLELKRRANHLYSTLQQEPTKATINDWLCVYAMAVNEENASGHMVVTAPTNGAAGVIPAVLYYFVQHEGGNLEQVRIFLLTASAIGGIIKHNSSISGAEMGCQGEVGAASAMAAAGLCAIRGGTPQQIENAAEIALEHHLGMTCDPVNGLVQVPCIERNGFGAIKAYTAASLALRGNGQHFMPLDNCIAAMKQTGEEMSNKFKETSLGGLAVNVIEC